jgi:hypothetical protein
MQVKEDVFSLNNPLNPQLSEQEFLSLTLFESGSFSFFYSIIIYYLDGVQIKEVVKMLAENQGGFR